jgi:hypothetical protein
LLCNKRKKVEDALRARFDPLACLTHSLAKYVIVGAVERMRSRGREVCLFVAWDSEMVRGLRREWRALERQTEQSLCLGFWNYDAWDMHDGQ